MTTPSDKTMIDESGRIWPFGNTMIEEFYKELVEYDH